MDLQLTGKKVLITGSSRGIGKEIAKSLLDEGCKVAINSRNLEQLKIIHNEIKSDFYIAGDVTNLKDCKRISKEVVKFFGSIDILICNVGSGKSVSPGYETSDVNDVLDGKIDNFLENSLAL